jgi:hypothetical protein
MIWFIIKNEFPEVHQPTILEEYEKKIQFRGRQVLFIIYFNCLTGGQFWSVALYCAKI